MVQYLHRKNFHLNMTDTSQHGVSLLETVLYVGLLAIILPLVVMFAIGLAQQYNTIDPRTRMEQKSGLIFDQLAHDITSAQTIDVTASDLGVDDSRLVFIDDAGETVVIDRPTVNVDFGKNSEQVRRLRMQRGGASPVWVTDKDIDVSSWRVEAARDSNGDLTGLNVHLETQMLNAANGSFRQAKFNADTTYELSAHTNEQ
jgi:hypothetical protein